MAFSAFTLKRLRRDSRGTSVLELALILPVLGLMLTGMIDLTRVIISRLDLEQAAQRTTDFAFARLPTSNDTTYLVNEAASAAGVPAANVTAQLFTECNGVQQVNFTDLCPSGEITARFVSIEIEEDVAMVFDWQALSGVFGSTVLPSSVTVQGDSIVRIQ